MCVHIAFSVDDPVESCVRGACMPDDFFSLLECCVY